MKNYSSNMKVSKTSNNREHAIEILDIEPHHNNRKQFNTKSENYENKDKEYIT